MVPNYSLKDESSNKKSRASRSEPLEVPSTFKKWRPGKLNDKIKVSSQSKCIKNARF